MTDEEITLRIEEWHESTDTSEIYEYLGWTWEEYKRYVETGEAP